LVVFWVDEKKILHLTSLAASRPSERDGMVVRFSAAGTLKIAMGQALALRWIRCPNRALVAEDICCPHQKGGMARLMRCRMRPHFLRNGRFLDGREAEHR
jgi:hypothetical protein